MKKKYRVLHKKVKVILDTTIKSFFSKFIEPIIKIKYVEEIKEIF